MGTNGWESNKTVEGRTANRKNEVRVHISNLGFLEADNIHIARQDNFLDNIAMILLIKAPHIPN